MIDWTRVASLRDDVGAEDFDEVVALFLEEVDDAIDRLKSNPDVNGLEAELHFLKGSAMGLGFQDFSYQCQTGEALCREGRADEIDVPAVLSTYALSRQHFLRDMPAAFLNDAGSD